jgi:hypothetical protein
MTVAVIIATSCIQCGMHVIHKEDEARRLGLWRFDFCPDARQTPGDFLTHKLMLQIEHALKTYSKCILVTIYDSLRELNRYSSFADQVAEEAGVNCDIELMTPIETVTDVLALLDFRIQLSPMRPDARDTVRLFT